MKVKSRPDDFRVEEIAEPPLGAGPFAVYRLSKKSLGTPEAVEAICRQWRVGRDDVGFGGLKDRHAATRQFLSIHNGPRRNLRQTNFDLEYLGQMPRAYDSKDILANRFEVVLRDLAPWDADHIAAAFPAAAADGVPNYFDEQRFGSVGASGDFIARPWCLGDYERTLWLVLAEPNDHDRPGVREEKTSLRQHWGDWTACRPACVRPMSRAAMDRLCRQPHDFRGAFVCIPQQERRMFLGAFQSHLWNRILAETIRGLFDSAELVDIEVSRLRLPFYRAVTSSGAREHLERPLPLPSARGRSELGELAALYERVAGEFGLECRTLRVKFPRDSFFSRGSRAAVFRAQAISLESGYDELAHDEQSRSRRKLLLKFDLPPGSYATMLVKRLTETT